MSPDTPFHRGELAVQDQAGVGAMARRVGGSIRGEIPPAAADFLAQRRQVVLATTDNRRRPWASILTGPPGFIRVSDGPVVGISARPAEGDPLRRNVVEGGGHGGLLAIDFSTRRRMRVNGRLERSGGGEFLLEVEQAFSNCPKYIQRREELPGDGATTAVGTRHGTSLDPSQAAWIRGADTFFMATANPGEGADASHRGGLPGFIQLSGDTLRWPDYSGNMMFNSLGNIAVHPLAGLAIPDFQRGSVLQLTGRATIEWTTALAASSGRTISLQVEEVVEHRGVWPAMSEAVDYSPFNPPAESADG